MKRKKDVEALLRRPFLNERLFNAQREKLQHIEDEREHDERGADPLGRARELGVHASCLVLRHKGVGHAADRAAQAGGLAALEKHDAGDDQAADELKNGDKHFHNRRPPIS